MAGSYARTLVLLVGLCGPTAACVGAAAAAGARTAAAPAPAAAAASAAAPAGVYVLRTVGGRSLPVVFGDPAGGGYAARRLLAASLTFSAPGDSAHSASASRPVMLEHWPCEAVRAMRADQAAGRSGGITPAPAPGAGAADCDALRVEHDSSRASVRTWGADSVELRVRSEAADEPPTVLRGTARGDTLTLDTPYLPAGVPGPTARFLYVRSASRPSA